MSSRRFELAVFFAVAIVGVIPALSQPHAMVGDGVDAFGTWWFFDWIRLCVEHGGDPSYTRFFFWPIGKDNFAHTGDNFVDAVLSVPFQWLLGARYQPAWIVAMLVGNALTFRPFARLALGDDDRAFAATLLWLVNPYTMFEITAGRPTQAFLWFVPAVPYFCLRLARGGRWTDALWLGAACALVGWTYWYQAIFVAFLLIPVALAELRDAPDRGRTFRLWLLALGVAFLIVAPAAIPMARLWAEGGTPGGTPEKQSILKLPGAIGNSVGEELYGLALMEPYGAPLLTNFAWALPIAWALLSRRLGWRWWVGAAVCLVIGLGPGLRWGEEVRVNVPYMVLYRYLPFFNRLWFPYRLASVIFVVAALGIAAALPARRLRLWAVVLAALGLAEQTRSAAYPFTWHDLRTPQLLVEAGKQGGALLFLPFRIQHDGLIWQTFFDLPTFGGMGESAPVLWPKQFKRQLSTPIAQALRLASTGSEPVPTLPGDALQPLRGHGFRWVVLRRDLVHIEQMHLASIPDPEESVRRVSAVLGEPVGVDGSVVLWDLAAEKWTPPAAYQPTPESLSDAGWTPTPPPEWSTRLSEQGRSGRPMGGGG